MLNRNLIDEKISITNFVSLDIAHWRIKFFVYVFPSLSCWLCICCKKIFENHPSKKNPITRTKRPQEQYTLKTAYIEVNRIKSLYILISWHNGWIILRFLNERNVCKIQWFIYPFYDGFGYIYVVFFATTPFRENQIMSLKGNLNCMFETANIFMNS